MALITIIGGAVTGCAHQDVSTDKTGDTDKDTGMPSGGSADTKYAADLWNALLAADLVGPKAIQTRPYPGQPPHGAVLQYIDTTLTVNGQSGSVIVMGNFAGVGVSIDNVARNPKRYLTAVTVMYKRANYDPDNANWFWVRYLTDGTLDKDPQGLALAGRIGKADPPTGCIKCHLAAPGNDRVFNNNRIK